MLTLYNKDYSLNIIVKTSTVINDTLYVVILEGITMYTVKLVRIDLTRLIEIDSYIINYRPHNNTEFKIFKDKLYCYTYLIDERSIEDSYVDVNDVSVFDINTLEETHFKIEELRGIFELHDELYFFKFNEDEDIDALTVCVAYDLFNFKTGERILIIIDEKDETYFEDGILYLSFGIDTHDGIFTSGNDLIFKTNQDELIYYNIADNKINSGIDLKEIYRTTFGFADDSEYPLGNSRYNDIGEDRIFGNNIIFDYSKLKSGSSDNLNIKRYFLYDGHGYYIHTTEDNTVFNIDISISRLKNDFPINDAVLYPGYPEYIIIGSENHNIEVPLKLMYDNSEHIKDLVDMSNGTLNTFINDKYEDIELYVSHLNGNDMYINTLYRLYTISVFMLDINVEYLTYEIIYYINTYGINAVDGWELLKVFYNFNVYGKFKILLYIMYKTCNREEFLSMTETPTDMNKFIIADLLRTRIIA